MHIGLNQGWTGIYVDVDQIFVVLMTFGIFSLYGQTNATLQLEINGKLVHISLKDGSIKNLVTVPKRQFGGP